MSAVEILTGFVERANRNPLNARKFYFEYKGILEQEGGETLELSFGSSESNSIVVKDVYPKGINPDDKMAKERLFSKMLEVLSKSIYERIDTDTFSSNLWSKIVRVDNVDNGNYIPV
jgi:hypothetical protein